MFLICKNFSKKFCDSVRGVFAGFPSYNVLLLGKDWLHKINWNGFPELFLKKCLQNQCYCVVKCLGEFIVKLHGPRYFCCYFCLSFVGKFEPTNWITLINMELFMLALSSWISFGNFCLSNNLLHPSLA